MRFIVDIVLCLVLCVLAASCSTAEQSKVDTAPAAWSAPSDGPTYPEDVTQEQKQLLIQLGDLKWFTSIAPKKHRERTQQELATLLEKIRKTGLPALASPTDIQVSASVIKNTSNRDVLIVLQHETGFDVAVRTHWLPAGKAIPNRSSFARWGKVWIIAPNMEKNTDHLNATSGSRAEARLPLAR